MAASGSTYHPTYGDVWNDERLGDFEGRSFFVFLFSHHRVRPSGIYRATDDQLAVDSGLPVKRVRAHLDRYVATGRIVRDGAWLFVVGYFKRQAKGPQLLKGVQADVSACTSAAVLEAFGSKYSAHSQWSSDRLATLDRPMLLAGASIAPTQHSTAQHSTPHHTRENSRNGAASPHRSLTAGFDEFWEAYPPHRRSNKQDAAAAWKALAPDPDLCAQMQRALEAQKQVVAQGNALGIFIPDFPHPHRWLRKRRWEDEPIVLTREQTVSPTTAANMRAVQEAIASHRSLS
jgi:hypothetical protein